MDAKVPCLEPSVQTFARPLGGPFRVRTKFQDPAELCFVKCASVLARTGPSIHPSKQIAYV